MAAFLGFPNTMKRYRSTFQPILCHSWSVKPSPLLKNIISPSMVSPDPQSIGRG